MWRRSVAQIPRKIGAPVAAPEAEHLISQVAHEHGRDSSNAASPFDEACEQ